MTFKDKRTGSIGSTENPVLIEMYLANTEVFEVVEEKKPEAEQVKKPVRRSAKKAE